MSMDNTVQVFDDMLLREIKGYLRDDRDIVIFGCGQIGEMCLHAIQQLGRDIKYFVDSDKNKQNTRINEKEVKNPYDLMLEQNITILLALSWKNEVEELLNGMGFVKDEDYFEMRTGEVKQLDLYDPFLGYTRMDDIEGFKIFGTGEEKIKIVAMGGSTTDWSFGNIKSWSEFLYENLKLHGVDVCVYNGGIPGYTSNQQVLKLIRDVLPLKPNIVINFDGVNDAAGKCFNMDHPFFSPYMQSTVEGLIKGKTDFDVTKIKGRVTKNRIASVGYGTKSKLDSVENCYSNLKIMNSVCKEFGIKFYYCMQPVVWDGMKEDCFSTEKEIQYRNSLDAVDEVCSFYKKMVKIVSEESFMYDLTDLFIDKLEIFIDDCHCNEIGNQVIAARIEEIIENDLKLLERKEAGIN